MATLPLLGRPYSFVAESAPVYTDGRNPGDESADRGFVQDIRRAIDEINAVSLEKISDLQAALECLEETPEDYRSLCKDGDVETLIKQIEISEADEKKARKYITCSQKQLENTNAALAGKLREADGNLYDIVSLLQEIRWRIMILDRGEQPGSGKVYGSAKEALDALWS